jgi:iron complex transport system permease protein
MRGRLLIVIALSVAAIAISPFLGASLDPETGSFVLWQLRIPRTILGVLVGSTLGLTGAVYQTIFSNPLATPSTVGTTAGASLGVLFVLVLFPTASLQGLPIIAVAAFIGALLVTLLIAAIAASGRARVNDLLLVGIGITLASSAAYTGLQFQADMESTFQAVRWSLGSLAKVGYRDVVLMLPFALVTHLVLLSQIRALEALTGGEARAFSQGVPVVKVRTRCLGIGALGVGASVALCGPIAFVGLLVPHLVRLSIGSQRRILLPMSAITGAAFLALCDGIARWILPERNLPVGVLTAALGAVVLILLVVRRKEISER